MEQKNSGNEIMKWDLIKKPTLPGSDGPAADMPKEIPVQGGRFQLNFQRLVGGKSDGVDVLEVDTGAIRVLIIPTRGMGLWKAFLVQDETKEIGQEIGWQSPVAGPVHPSLVPIQDASGIGWLEGFDELLVRCGLESNGAPEFNPNGTVKHPLHGRIANLPASQLSVSVDPQSGVLEVTGTVFESRFLVHSLELRVTYRFEVNCRTIGITDVVTNRSGNPSTMQLLYHINVGQRILEAGSKCVAALTELAPRDQHASKAIDRWDQYDGPVSGFQEQVYFAKPQSNNRGWTTAMLQDSTGSSGIAVRYDTRTIPYFTLWKNTAAVEDGYVTGLEPATGFPNTKSFESHSSRTVKLTAGESRSFSLQLEPLALSTDVDRVQREIDAIRTTKCCIHHQPLATWCEGA
jgi:galactose mutarotase-like enzyme